MARHKTQYLSRESVVRTLLHGGYIRKTMSHTGAPTYKLLDAAHNPLHWLHRPCKRLLKVCHIKHMHKSTHMLTLNLNAVKQLHGNDYIKRMYRQHLWHNSQPVQTPCVPCYNSLVPQKATTV